MHIGKATDYCYVLFRNHRPRRRSGNFGSGFGRPNLLPLGTRRHECANEHDREDVSCV
jgi:hypothetical protein